VNEQRNALSADNVGGRLRLARNEKGWTQQELAVRARTTQAVIQKIEEPPPTLSRASSPSARCEPRMADVRW
jgi:ribosome-binding protein aMBF1 (putative translation factor)